MIQGWKCNFCTFDVSDIKIKVHEDSCKFNPKNKYCHSCKYYEVQFMENHVLLI